jgi:hypothetical protein
MITMFCILNLFLNSVYFSTDYVGPYNLRRHKTVDIMCFCVLFIQFSDLGDKPIFSPEHINVLQ